MERKPKAAELLACIAEQFVVVLWCGVMLFRSLTLQLQLSAHKMILHISYPYPTFTEHDLFLEPYLGGCLSEEVDGLEQQQHMLTVTTALIAIIIA